MFNLIMTKIFIQIRKPGPVGQVRDDRLSHRSSLLLVSGVSKNRVLNSKRDFVATNGQHQ